MDDRQQIISSNVTPELYFLITKFLAHGPLRNASEVLMKELERLKLFPRRIDWTGQEHEQSFAELERQFSHIGQNHLLDICKRVPVLLDKELIPSVSGVTSLLGARRQSLLRAKETVTAPKTIVGHCSRIHGMPVLESISKKPMNNIVQVLYGRESSGPITRKLAVPTKFYGKLDLLRRTLGHLSAVYCVLFDRSGKYIITGADDLLVKLWSAIDGRLLATFRGASAEITDIAVNLDNTLLAAGSLDRILRVWDMQTGGPIAVLSGHTGMITSVNFYPSQNRELKYLVTTSTDGSMAFWQYNSPRGAKSSFASEPIQYHEKIRPGQAQMICGSFSPGGKFLAAGFADHHVRVYLMGDDGPQRILEIEAHTDTVDSIQWAHQGLKFVSGGKDGIAYLWTFESQQWKSMKLSMSERLPGDTSPDDDARKQLKVTTVSWDATDKWIITAVNDFSIKVWNSTTGKLHKVMTGHTDELFVLESHPIHPIDPHVLLSAGHDGQLFIWDITEGQSIAKFVNHIEGQGNGGVFDAKWSPDGSMIAATDSHGHILMYGFGSGHPRLKMLPKELFFHTDYRPLIRDVNHYVMDEQTQTIPHLMPPPFLVDVDGNPHPPSFQRLVPGRENCTTDQLIPNITIGPEGVEVVESPNTVPNIDRLIAALANRQGPGQAPDSNSDRNPQGNNRPSNSPRANGRVGLRRSGDVEGARQSSGNVNLKWIRRIYVQPMRYSRLQALRQKVCHAGLHEQDVYRREMRRRPMMINTAMTSSSSLQTANRNRGRGRRSFPATTPAYRTTSSSSSDSENDSSDNDSDYEPSIPLSALGTLRARRRNSDSEESYKPNRRPIKEPKRRKKRKEDKKEKVKKTDGTVNRVGRPAKQRIVDYALNNRNSETPKKSSGRPKRNQRQRESSSSSDDEPKPRKVRKLRGYSSDNSLPLNNSLASMERNPLETDSDSQMVRSTRGRKKKTRARDVDSPEEQTTSQRTNNIFRREIRSRASQEDSEDDQALSQVMNNFRSRSRRNFVSVSASIATNGTSSRTVTRQQIPTSSQRSLPSRHDVMHQRSSVQIDHNYGEPGPSSRHTRRSNVPYQQVIG